MFFTGLMIGGTAGAALGVAVMCLLTAGSWEDDEMERLARKTAEKKRNGLKTNTEESREEECEKETT